MLSGLAAAVGNTRRIMLKRGWTEPAILWTAVIGESGTQKSPAFRLALKAVRDRQHRLMKEHLAAMKDWEAQNELHEIAMSNWKKAAAKSDKQNDTPPDPPEAPEQPICPRNWIEDCTTEALAMFFPQYAVSKWIGHSITISGRHYANAVPDELLDKASDYDGSPTGLYGSTQSSTQRIAQ